METKTESSKLIPIICAVIFIAFLYNFSGERLDKQVSSDLQKIENQVALDAEKQYEIAKRGGDKMQTYVQASMVATAYLQAKDEVNYNKWKAIEKEEAKNAGMPIE